MGRACDAAVTRITGSTCVRENALLNTDTSMPLQSYRQLRVWQRGMALANECCALADCLPSRERFALAAQVRRAAVSIPANVAEGYGRNGRAEYVHHIGIARGSLYELETLIEIARLRGYLKDDVVSALNQRTREVGSMLTRLRVRLAPPA
jgi:four helix bundle protein